MIDYTISYDQGENDYVILYDGILLNVFTAAELESGNIYKFKVQARNSYGLSDYSNELSLVCGFISDVP